MSKTQESKRTVLGQLSAVQTLLKGYPVLDTSGDDGQEETSFGFMLNVLRILGVSEEDLLNWIGDLLSSKDEDGVLDVIETSVKSILLINVKKMFSCSINPILPDTLMDDSAGMSIDTAKIDLNGILDTCPIGSYGRAFYFDADQSDYAFTDESSSGGANDEYNGYTMTVNDLWKSRDFNAYLWYILNKSSRSDSYKMYWDNRVSYFKKFKDSKSLMTSFFNTKGYEEGSNLYVKDPVHIPNSDIDKRYIIKCASVDEGLGNSTSKIRVYLNKSRYKNQRSITLFGENIWLNKTAFEFNFDYIYSLKLFNSKTLVTSVINSILGLLSYSVKQTNAEVRIREIVKKIIKSEDNSTDDCYFTFDNAEYERQLNESIRKHEGVFYFGSTPININKEQITDILSSIGSAKNVEAQRKAIVNSMEQIVGSVVENEAVSENDKVTFGIKIISQLIEETCIQVCLHVLSPKIAMLMEINGHIMGDTDTYDTPSKFFEDFENFLVRSIAEINDVILAELYRYMMKQLSPILDAYLSKLMLETVRYHLALLSALYESCVDTGYEIANGMDSVYAIDNVNYADIVPEQTSPQNRC